MTGYSSTIRLGSSGRAPLLAPSPLRTGLEGFPFIRLEHSKKECPHEKRGRGLVQNESDLLDTDLLPIRTAVESPSCVKLHQWLTPSSFALLHASVPQEFSS